MVRDGRKMRHPNLNVKHSLYICNVICFWIFLKNHENQEISEAFQKQRSSRYKRGLKCASVPRLFGAKSILDTPARHDSSRLIVTNGGTYNRYVQIIVAKAESKLDKKDAKAKHSI